MTYEPMKQQLSFVLPESSRNAELVFKSSSGQFVDIRLSIPADTQVRRVVSTILLGRGLWRVQLDWSLGKVSYYRERVIEVR